MVLHTKIFSKSDTIRIRVIIYYNMIAVFFPELCRFIPGFDRFIRGFGIFTRVNIPVTGTLPYNPNAHSPIKCAFFLYFDIILFYYFWLKYIFFYLAGCRLWSAGSDRSPSSVVNSMQEGPSEIAVVQISRAEYIINFITTWMSNFHRNGR